MAFKDRMKRMREARGLSQAALADALGLSIGGIGGYENGSRQPKPDILAKIAEFFNVPIADLEYGLQLSYKQYEILSQRLNEALDHISSDDFKAIGLQERAIRTALKQRAPIREDRAEELARDLGTNVDDILAMKPTFEDEERERRLEAYAQAMKNIAEKASPEMLDDIMGYAKYKIEHKGDKYIFTLNK